MDNADFITRVGDKRYYLKDHLGSMRAVIDDAGSLISAQDYDVWGYLLQDRTYDSEESVYKFTSKERDEKSEYDYFGARYYDAWIGRWGQVEPLMDKYISISPYCYGLNNPVVLLDADGLDLVVGGDKTAVLNDLRSLFTNVEIQNRISSDNNGLVSFDLSGLD